MKQVIAYKCEFCGKLYQRKYYCDKHEVICSKNPSNKRACFGCRYLISKQRIACRNTICGELRDLRSLLYCEKRKCYVYPPKIQIEKKWADVIGVSNNPMPMECEHYKPQVLMPEYGY